MITRVRFAVNWTFFILIPSLVAFNVHFAYRLFFRVAEKLPWMLMCFPHSFDGMRKVSECLAPINCFWLQWMFVKRSFLDQSWINIWIAGRHRLVWHRFVTVNEGIELTVDYHSIRYMRVWKYFNHNCSLKRSRKNVTKSGKYDWKARWGVNVMRTGETSTEWSNLNSGFLFANFHSLLLCLILVGEVSTKRTVDTQQSLLVLMCHNCSLHCWVMF